MTDQTIEFERVDEPSLLDLLPKYAEAVNAFTSPEVQLVMAQALIRERQPHYVTPVTALPLQQAPVIQATPITASVAEETVDPAPVTATVLGPAKRATARTRRAAPSRLPSASEIARDLDLRPDGVQSFRELAAEKQPSSNYEKCAVAVFWLAELGGVESISPAHIQLCFREAGWREPTDLPNIVSKASSLKHYLDSSDMSSIKLTIPGRNLVKHDLPAESERK